MAEKHLKKMFNILNYQGNANQNNPEIPSHTQSEWLRSKIQVTANAGKNVEKEEHSSTVGGIASCTTTLEISLVVPQKIGHSTLGGSRNTSPVHISRRCPNP